MTDERLMVRIRRMYEQSREQYAEYEVADVPPLSTKGVEPDDIYPQECFFRAFYYAMHIDRICEKGIWLVHGECGLAFGPHAWVELPDGLVFESVFQRFYRLEDFEKHMLGQAWYKFTPDAAFLIFRNMPRTDDGQFLYQWDVKLNLPWFKGVPLEIDFDKAWSLIVASGLREELPKKCKENRKTLLH